MPRRVMLAYANKEKNATEDLMKKIVIQKRSSPWDSLIELERKTFSAPLSRLFITGVSVLWLRQTDINFLDSRIC
ncbi:hypothetical protein DPMN_173054 [Dreissena polymorpha]|uniref:Uncharacterized protein n=1 Tax=Dreissena polymorpha TaxID=45954 RepID=A0A9D4IDV5_DREPO|nr:hypothetical protein DPMN_173054 [Dreissena polymorpha]